MKRWFIGIFLGVFFLPLKAPAKEVRLNLWPLFFYAQEEDRFRLEILGPFVYRYRNTKENSFSIRPLYTRVERKKARTEDVYFLSPLGHYHEEDAFQRFRLVPLFSYDRMKGEKKPGRHHAYFPIFWGETEKGEKYRGFFPFYGFLKDRFGYDEIRFVLWPVYSTSRKGANRSTNILWPIFNYSRGPELSGFKVWPLCGIREEKGRFRRSFFLWPLFIKEERYAAEGSEQKRMFFPFWIEEKNHRYRKTIYLWPFFQYYETIDGDFRQWDVPWPFVQIQKGQEKRGFRLFPLFGYRQTPEKESRFILWPILQTERLSRGGEEETETRVLLLSRWQKVVYNGREKENFVRVWPLFVRYRHESQGFFFYFPAILPFYDEGLERNLGPLLKLLEYYRFPDGRRYLKLLWGFYRYEAGPQESIQELAFLLSIRRKPEGFEFSFLHGFVALGQEKGRLKLKLFWIPLR